MSNAATTSRPPLRRDLQSHVRRGQRRAYRIVIDEVSGQFSRVSEHLWQRLQRGDADESVWQAADAAGWTRCRTKTSPARLNLLYIRLPIASIDGLATKLASLTPWLFAPLAVLAWTALIAVAMMLAIGRLGEITASLGSLQQFFVQSDPLWLGMIFVCTKIAHELGHAIVCRRVGSRCGRVGLLLLCGMPCPYCDVTDVWRQGSTVKRIAVMFAGIYVELILAALATFTWALATDPTIRLHALNLMVVCGVSTLLFNANPLMRYDGYYVLSDLVGSTNLRQESADAFRRVVIRPLAGSQYRSPSQTNVRTCLLSVYHATSKIYRMIVMIAIAALLLGIAEYFQVRQLAVAVMVMAVVAMIVRTSKRLTGVVRGKGSWNGVPSSRRLTLTVAVSLFGAAVLFVPLPRYRSASGWIDASDATNVYLVQAGVIERVGFDFGDRVESGDLLVGVSNDTMELDRARLQGSVRLASLRRGLSRRGALDRGDTAEQWSTLKAAEQAATDQLTSIQKRIDRCDVKAPIAGIVLPPSSSLEYDEPLTLSLRRRVGASSTGSQPWCRISPSGAVHAVLILDARDRMNITAGSPVNLSLSTSSGKVITSQVHSVSAIQQETESVTRPSRYQVLCQLPEMGTDDVLSGLGQECWAVFHLPFRSMADDIVGWLQSWIDGEMS